MNIEKTTTEKEHLNEDPITKEPGAHPLSTGVGAAGAGTIGAVIGTAVGGPVGGIVGAALGAFVGGLGGSAVGEAIEPTTGTSAADSEIVPGSSVLDAADTPALDSTIDTGLTPFNAVGTDPALPVGEGNGLSGLEETEKSRHIALPEFEEVRQRAWDIWAFEGFPEGRDVENWLKAERELTFLTQI